MIKPFMQIPPMTKMVAYDGKVRVMFNEMIEFEFIYKTSQLTVYIPAPKGNPVPRMIYDSLMLTPEEHERS